MFVWLVPLIFFVSITEIKVQAGFINDNLELCPNTEATIWAMSSIMLSPKAGKEKGKFRLSTAFIMLNHSHPPPPHCHISQLVQGFEISWPNHRTWERLISVYMKLWLWLQTWYLPELTSVILYTFRIWGGSGFSGSKDEWSLFVLASRDNLLPECILFKTILTNKVQLGGDTFGLAFQTLKNGLWCSEFTFVILHPLQKWVLEP